MLDYNQLKLYDIFQISYSKTYLMGNLTSTSNFNNNNTEQIGIKIEQWRLINDQKIYKIWQNKMNKYWHIQQYSIEYDSNRDYVRLKQMYQFRRNNKYIVQAYNIPFENNRMQCCSSPLGQSIFTQRIPLRLDQLEHIPWPDYLHIYDRCFRGYYELSKKFGYFQVQDYMIGINQQHEVKVWICENLGKTTLSTNQISQQNMIKSILYVLSKIIDDNPHLPRLNEYILKNSNGLFFENVINTLTAYSLTFNNGIIPVRLTCIDSVGGVHAIINHLVLQSSKYQQTNVQEYKINQIYKPQSIILKNNNDNTQSRGDGLIINKQIKNQNQFYEKINQNGIVSQFKNNQNNIMNNIIINPSFNNYQINKEQNGKDIKYLHQSEVKNRFTSIVESNIPPNNHRHIIYQPFDNNLKNPINPQPNTFKIPPVARTNSTIMTKKVNNSIDSSLDTSKLPSPPQIIQQPPIIKQNDISISSQVQNTKIKHNIINPKRNLPLLPTVYEHIQQLNITPIKFNKIDNSPKNTSYINSFNNSPNIKQPILQSSQLLINSKQNNLQYQNQNILNINKQIYNPSSSSLINQQVNNSTFLKKQIHNPSQNYQISNSNNNNYLFNVSGSSNNSNQNNGNIKMNNTNNSTTLINSNFQNKGSEVKRSSAKSPLFIVQVTPSPSLINQKQPLKQTISIKKDKKHKGNKKNKNKINYKLQTQEALIKINSIKQQENDKIQATLPKLQSQNQLAYDATNYSFAKVQIQSQASSNRFPRLQTS